MNDYTDIFATLLDRRERTDNYDIPTVYYVQSLVVAFEKKITTDRTTRMRVIGDVVGRTVASAKDLKVGEIAVLLDMLDDPHFIAAMRREYCE